MNQKRTSLYYLEALAPSMPGPIYWKDRHSVYLGMNELALKVTGLKYFADIIGKTDYDLWPDLAKQIVEHDREVTTTGKEIHRKEAITIPTGEIKYFTVIKVPLNDDGNIIGVIGNSIDITAQKDAERLRLENQRLIYENETQKIRLQLEEQAKFRKIVDQMSHDMGSPLMALSVLQDRCAELPESKRNMLRESIKSIREIANSLLNQYKPKEMLQQESADEVLVYPILEQLILDKELEYQDLRVKFELSYNKDDIFSFIKADASLFKRMLSNLVNNSVGACEGKAGTINLELKSSQESISITIEDNGKGMSRELIDILRNGISITHDKKDGLGIGFTQIRDTLQNNNGEIVISSEIGVGTKISIAFPKIETPTWIAKEVKLSVDDIVVILDDDPSIHGAWDIKFEDHLKQNSNLQIKHFTLGKEAISFINELDEIDKKRIFLLTDYELLGQRMNGLDVINRTKIIRSILVTSHANDKSVLDKTSAINTKILPKKLAAFVDIRFK